MSQPISRAALVASVLSVTALVGVLASGLGTPAKAYPPYAKKEGVSCAYCHVSPEVNKKVRNYRGLYYKTHENSFAGFDDAAEAKKAGVEVGPEADKKPTSQTAPAGDKPADKPAETPAEKPAEKPVEKPATPAEKKLTAAELQAKVKTAETAYKAKPKDATLKKAYAAALADLGHGAMLDEAIPPRQRYPQALKYYRKALTLDPTNKVATDNIKMIEDVYKSMGKEVPKG